MLLVDYESHGNTQVASRENCDPNPLYMDWGTNGVLALLAGHPLSHSPAVLCITGWVPQPSTANSPLGLAGRRRCCEVEEWGKKPGGFFPFSCLPWWRHGAVSCQQNLERQIPPCNAGHPILCIRYCFLLLAVSRFLSSYLAFLFSHPFRNQLPELNSLHLNLLLVCVLMVGYWQSFHLNIKSFPELVLLVEN